MDAGLRLAALSEPLITFTTSVSVGEALPGRLFEGQDAQEGATAKRAPSRAARVMVPYTLMARPTQMRAKSSARNSGNTMANSASSAPLWRSLRRREITLPRFAFGKPIMLKHDPKFFTGASCQFNELAEIRKSTEVLLLG